MADYNHKQIASLVRSAQSGSSDAFAQLYGLTCQKVYTYSTHYLRDENLAKDATQETFITAFKNLRGLKDPSLFVAWLNQISFHTCYDMRKKLDSSYGLIDYDFLELTQDEKIEHNPEENYEITEEQEILKEALENLPFHEKQVIVLRYFNDMKIEDVAKALSISRSSVKRYIKSALERLQKTMERRNRDV